jgi:hypothetical protein
MIDQLQNLMKALEAGVPSAAPGSRVQGAALQDIDMSPVMQNVCFSESQIKLQKTLNVKPVKSTLHQFRRQLSYGTFGGSAQYEGGVGEDSTSQYVDATVPMAFYSETRRVTEAAKAVSAFDGVAADDRVAQDAALKIAGDIEFELWQGQANFSNAGVFDGNPLLAQAANMPGMVGIDQQVRQSDSQANTQDLMFASYGSDQTVVLSVNGTLSQTVVDDSAVRSAMNMGDANRLLVDPIALNGYNKIAHAKERIMLSGSAQEATGANLRTQWTSSGPVSIEASRFLSGKTRPNAANLANPLSAPSFTAADGGAAGSSLAAAAYTYYITAQNIRGESMPSAPQSVTPAAAGNKVVLTISPVAGAQMYSVYRSAAGGSAASAKFIGKTPASILAFTDLGNRLPGSVTGFLIEEKTMGIVELSPFKKYEMARADLSEVNAFARMLALAVYQPRKNVLLENIQGQLS